MAALACKWVKAKEAKRKAKEEEAVRQAAAGEVAVTMELSELSGTPEVGHDKGKGLELTPESMMGQESQKCDSCEQCRVECVRLKVSSLDLLSTELTNFQGGWKKSCKLCYELCIKCKKEFWYGGKEGDKEEEGISNKVRRARELEGDWEMELQELLGEVAKTNWLLWGLWQSVEGVQSEL